MGHECVFENLTWDLEIVEFLKQESHAPVMEYYFKKVIFVYAVEYLF